MDIDLPLKKIKPVLHTYVPCQYSLGGYDANKSVKIWVAIIRSIANKESICMNLLAAKNSI